MINKVPDVPKDSRADLSPSAGAIKTHYYRDKDDLIDAMLETHLYGMAQTVNGDKLDLLYRRELPSLYQPFPGRCLWGWDKVAKLADDLLLLPPDTNLLLGISQRPSHKQPATEGVTPLHAIYSVGAVPIQLVRLARHLEVPTKVSRGRISEYFLPQTMGRHNAEYFDNHTFLTQPPRNSKRTAWQHYAIENSPVSVPFQMTLLKRPPVYDALRPRIQEVFAKAQESTSARLKLTDKAIRYYLAAQPDPVQWEQLFLDPDDLDLLTARQMVAVSHNTYSCDAAITLLSSIISGVSPAVLARTALEEIRIKGLSFLDATQVMAMINLIDDLPKPKGSQQQANREELTLELYDIADEMDAVFAIHPLSRQEELYWMRRQPEYIPALGHAPVED